MDLGIGEDAAIEPPVGSDRKLSPRDSLFRAESLGSDEFRRDHGVKLAYVAGAMYKGVASAALVIRMGRAGLIGYFGTGGLKLDMIESSIANIKTQLGDEGIYGMNLLCDLARPEFEDATVRLFCKHGIQRIEAAAYMYMTTALVYYRVKGIQRDSSDSVVSRNYVLSKVSRPEVAEQFMAPPPEKHLRKLVERGDITTEEALLAERIPMSDDVCVEADSAGHTDQGVLSVLMPAMTGLRDQFMKRYRYAKRIRVGAAGGLGTPEAIAAAFLLGADFVLTGSINQCTVEAGTSDLVKDMLSAANVQDTTLAPAGDMFELGAKIQVLRKGVFFPARANRLYELYRQHSSLDEIDPKTVNQIERRFFKRSLDEVWKETRDFYMEFAPEYVANAERNPKQKMSLLFRWYFIHSTRIALNGISSEKVDFQIQCGPAMGSFNQWIKGTRLEDWHNRHVDEIGFLLMREASLYLERRFTALQTGCSSLLENQTRGADRIGDS